MVETLQVPQGAAPGPGVALAAQPLAGGGEQRDDAAGLGDVVGPHVRGGVAELGHAARRRDDVIGRARRVDGEERRLFDLVVVPAAALAVGPAAPRALPAAAPAKVAGVGVAGDQAQGLLLPSAADDQVGGGG